MSKFTNTQQKFKELINLVEKQRPGYIQSLGQGSPIEELSDLMDNPSLPEELIAIYSCVRGTSWDGLEDDKLMDLIPSYGLIPIDEIEEEIRSLSKVRDEFPNYWWKPDMVPFLRDYSSDYYCVRTLPDDHSIVSIMHDCDGAPPYYQDIESFLDTVIECYKQGAYFLDEEGFLVENEELEEQIRKKFNPDFPRES